MDEGLLQEGDSIFDGFMHRGYDEEVDGWRNLMLQREDFLCMQVATDIQTLFSECNRLRRENWLLQKQLERAQR